MNDHSDCVFCKIVAGEIPADKVYEDDETLAFLDIQPNNPGHTLVVPKALSQNIFDISDESLCSLMRTVKKVAPAVKRAVAADGLNISMNNESAAGQVVFHTHVHVIPRFSDDGYKHWPHKPYKEGEATQIAEKIRTEL